jgi:hypothetical protein
MLMLGEGVLIGAVLGALPGSPLRRCAVGATIKARWVCRQAHQQPKEELGRPCAQTRFNGD